MNRTVIVLALIVQCLQYGLCHASRNHGGSEMKVTRGSPRVPVVSSQLPGGLAFVWTPAELWTIRAASAITTYFGFVAVTDRPRGQLLIDPKCLEMKASTVPGAGLGLFVRTTLRQGTVLGTYPGVVVPLPQNTNKLRAFPQCEGYTWIFSDNQFVIDPTNPQGEIDDVCRGGNLSMPFSVALFQTLLGFVKVPTTLCRINEPPKGRDVNVVTAEDLASRTVTFTLERDVYEGEELFIDYGLSYDRSRYGGGEL